MATNEMEGDNIPDTFSGITCFLRKFQTVFQGFLCWMMALMLTTTQRYDKTFFLSSSSYSSLLAAPLVFRLNAISKRKGTLMLHYGDASTVLWLSNTIEIVLSMLMSKI